MILKQGDQGSYVRELQKALNDSGANIDVDGDFGPETYSAVLTFQSVHGLARDGLVGPATQAALKAAELNITPTPSPSSGTPSPAQPAPVATISGPYVKGVDIYHLDAVVSWTELKAAGYEFVTIKASQGLDEDPKCEQFVRDARASGFIIGLYHFYVAGIDQLAQARLFVSICNKVALTKQEFPPVFDFETKSGDYSAQDGSNCKAFVEAVHSMTSRLPMIYMGYSAPEQLGNPEWLNAYPWWIPRYRSTSTGNPGVNTWAEWQYSGSAKVPGINNPADVDIFHGDLDDLKAFIAKT